MKLIITKLDGYELHLLDDAGWWCGYMDFDTKEDAVYAAICWEILAGKRATFTIRPKQRIKG